ncbi:MAG: hypothetical protein H7125_03260 [Proteobacteria bacterium]|nr:hypothetical protein [Burkholderiales bacterium]
MSARACTARSRVAFCIALFVALPSAGCAVGGGTIRIAADRSFEPQALEQVAPGMPEAAVVAALGLPASFGVDDRGRHYLQYNQLRIGAQMIAGGTGVIGVNGTFALGSTTGFDVRVFIEEGRVARVAQRTFHAAERADR